MDEEYLEDRGMDDAGSEKPYGDSRSNGSKGCNHSFSSHPGYHEPEFMETEEARVIDIMEATHPHVYFDDYSSEEYDYIGEG